MKSMKDFKYTQIYKKSVFIIDKCRSRPTLSYCQYLALLCTQGCNATLRSILLLQVLSLLTVRDTLKHVTSLSHLVSDMFSRAGN